MDDKKTKRLSGVKRTLLMASPAKVFGPGRKLKTLLTQGSDEPETQSVPIDDEATRSGASDMAKDTVASSNGGSHANHLNLLQNINPTGDVEKLVNNQYQ